jgi:hypothetical protein
VDHLEAADAVVVDVGSAEEGDGGVVAGPQAGPLLVGVDAEEFEAQHGLGDLLLDLPVDVDEGLAAGEAFLEDRHIGVDDLGQRPCRPDRVLHLAGIGGDGLQRNRECQVHAVAVEDGAAGGRQRDAADALRLAMFQVSVGLEDLEGYEAPQQGGRGEDEDDARCDAAPAQPTGILLPGDEATGAPTAGGCGGRPPTHRCSVPKGLPTGAGIGAAGSPGRVDWR